MYAIRVIRRGVRLVVLLCVLTIPVGHAAGESQSLAPLADSQQDSLPEAIAPGGPASAATLHFFVEPLLRKGFGGTSYDLSFDAGGGVTGLSRLEFPVRSLEAGASLGIWIERNGRRQWLLEAAASHSTFPITALMYDYDWWEPAGYPRIPFSYTYSQDTTVSWQASLGVAWTAASRGPWLLALFGTYQYQSTHHVEDTITGWQYVWNSTAGAYDLYVFYDPTPDVLEYSLISHTLGIGLLGSYQPTSRFTTELRARLTPLYVSDSDDHKLRTRLATASGFGIGAAVDARAIFHFQRKVGTSTPYLALGGGLSFFAVPTTETQYWYGDADAANGAPQGTLITGVGDTIRGMQYQLGVGMGFAF